MTAAVKLVRSPAKSTLAADGYREVDVITSAGPARGLFEMLEPCAVKVARTVLRGLGGSNAARLPDPSGAAFDS